MIKKNELWNSISCSLKDVVGDLLNVVEGQVQPGDLLGGLHHVQGQLEGAGGGGGGEPPSHHANF